MGRCGIILLLSGFLLGACRSQRVEYVTLDRWHTDTLLSALRIRDSIYVHDSVHVREGKDTVWMERWHTRYSKREVHDTLYISKTDSIPQPYPIERPLTRWESTKLDWGGRALACLALLLLAGAWKFCRRYRL